MVEVTIIFITISPNVPITECTSIFLYKDRNIYKTMSELVKQCSNFNDKAKEMINKTPFKIKKIISTFGLSYIVIVEKNKFLPLSFKSIKDRNHSDRRLI